MVDSPHDKLWHTVRDTLPEAEETIMTLEEQLEQRGLQKGLQRGRQEGRQEGLEEGRQEALIEAVQTLLEARFGGVDPSVAQRLRGADQATLKQVLRRAASAASLDEVWGE